MNFRSMFVLFATLIGFIAVSIAAPMPQNGIALPGSGESALSWLNRLISPLPIVGPLTQVLGIGPPPKQQQQQQPAAKKPAPARNPAKKPAAGPQRRPAAGVPAQRA
ncbi:hypothetical protein J3B02_005228, partial [Coemansia erecta]